MTKPPCVFHFDCGNPSGANEHLLQAALGGRRTFRKVTCDACAKAFAEDLDNVLPQELRLLLTYLGVTGDHNSRPCKIQAEDVETGEAFELDSNLRLDRAKPKLVETLVVDGVVQKRFVATKADQLPALLAELERNGTKVELLGQHVEDLLVARPPSIRSGFGGDRTFRAVGRQALNFLARYFPDAARSAGLEPFKRYVLGQKPGDFVRFAAPVDAPFPMQPYQFCYRILVGIGDDRVARARIEMLGTYTLVVEFGPVDLTSPGYKLIDINPLERDARDGVDMFDHGYVVVPDAVFSGSLEAVECVLEQARVGLARAKRTGEDRAWQRVHGEMCTELGKLASMPSLDRRRALREVLALRKQHGLNLLVAVVDRFAEGLSNVNASERAVHLIRAFGSSRPGDVAPSGLANACADLIVARLADRLDVLMAEGVPDEPTLRDLFEGVEGRRLAFSVVCEALSWRPD